VLSANLVEIQVHEQAEEEEKPTRKLLHISKQSKSGQQYSLQQVASSRENGGYHIRK
jgi:hypothetical protein